MNKVRIVSDGHIYGTKITMTDTGEQINCVTRVQIDINGHSGGPVEAILNLVSPEIDIVSAANTSPWPPPQYMLDLFRTWYLLHGPRHVEAVFSGVNITGEQLRLVRWELASVQNALEFKRHGLQRVS